MRTRGYAVSILLFNLATTGLANNVIQCNPEMAVSWSYDRVANTSVFSETNDASSGISLNFDFGFLKLTQIEGEKTERFRQSVIEQSAGDPLELEVRYESTSNVMIERTSVVVFDPFCRRNNELRASIIVTSGASFIYTEHTCECLSAVQDKNSFVY